MSLCGKTTYMMVKVVSRRKISSSASTRSFNQEIDDNEGRRTKQHRLSCLTYLPKKSEKNTARLSFDGKIRRINAHIERTSQ